MQFPFQKGHYVQAQYRPTLNQKFSRNCRDSLEIPISCYYLHDVPLRTWKKEMSSDNLGPKTCKMVFRSRNRPVFQREKREVRCKREVRSFVSVERSLSPKRWKVRACTLKKTFSSSFSVKQIWLGSLRCKSWHSLSTSGVKAEVFYYRGLWEECGFPPLYFPRWALPEWSRSVSSTF